MPNLLQNLIDPSMLTSGYPGRETMLSKAMSRTPQRAPIPQPITARPPQRPMVQPTSQGTGLQSIIKDRETKDAQAKVKAALDEITETRNRTKKKFLTPVQRLGIFTKHGIPQFAAKMINDAITKRQKDLEPKYETVSEFDPATGQTRKRRVPQAELRGKGILTGQAKPERAYKVGQVVGDKQVTGYDKAGMPTFKQFKTGKKLDKYGRTAKERFAHNRNKLLYTKDAIDREDKDRLGTEYDAGVYGWKPSTVKATTTGKIIEGYKTPEGFIDLWGKSLPPIKPKKREKGRGYFGELKMTDGSGRSMTELSIGVNIDGKEVEIPSFVPTLNEKEINDLRAGKEPTEEIVRKATAHARTRMDEGKSPFWQEGEAVVAKKDRFLGGVTGAWREPTRTLTAPRPIVDVEDMKKTATQIAGGVSRVADAANAVEKYILDTGLSVGKKIKDGLIWWVEKAVESQKQAKRETFGR